MGGLVAVEGDRHEARGGFATRARRDPGEDGRADFAGDGGVTGGRGRFADGGEHGAQIAEGAPRVGVDVRGLGWG